MSFAATLRAFGGFCVILIIYLCYTDSAAAGIVNFCVLERPVASIGAGIFVLFARAYDVPKKAHIYAFFLGLTDELA